MGVVNLPTYQSQAVEKPAPSQANPAFQGLAALQGAQKNFYGTLFEGAVKLAGDVIQKVENDQYSAKMKEMADWDATELRKIEQQPITSRDPRMAGIPDSEKATPNLSDFSTRRQEKLDQVLGDLQIPRVRQALQSWAADRFIAQKDSLAKFDFQKAKEVRAENLTNDVSSAIEAGNIHLVDDHLNVAVLDGTIDEAQSNKYADLARKDITKRNAYLQAVSMGAGSPGGLEWLADSKNLQYVTRDGKVQEMPLADRENLLQQFDTYLNTQDKVRNASYSDVHIRADTVAKVDQALATLRSDTSLRNDSKYTWEQRFLEARRYLLAGGLTPSEARSARDDMFKQQEDALAGEIALYRLDHPNDIAGMQSMVNDKYRLHLIRGDFVQTELGKLQTDQATSYKMGLSYLQDKAKGMTPEKTAEFASEFDKASAEFASEFDKAYRSSKKELSNEDAIKIATNITGKYVVRAATDYLSLRDRTAEIAAGKVAGIEQANMPALEQTAAFAQQQAARDFPGEGLSPKDGGIAFVDSSGQYGIGKGASILMNANHQPYSYKVENGQLQLYRLDHFTDKQMSVLAAGGIEYMAVPIKKIVQPKQLPAPATPAEIKGAVGEQPASLGTPGQSVNLSGLGTFYLKDWEKKADGEWYSKATGESASSIDPVISMSLDRLAKQAANK